MKLIKTTSGKKILKLNKRDWTNIGKQAGWVEAYSPHAKYELRLREKLNWKDRHELEIILESIGIACHESESDDELRDAIIANIEDNTLDPSVMEM